MSEPQQYAEGGYIEGGPILAWIHPDECLIRITDEAQIGWTCVRPSHHHDEDNDQ